MTFTLEQVQVSTDSADQEGRLVFTDGLLLAVLVRLSDQHTDNSGLWFLEAGFGVVADKEAPLFPDLDAAVRWLAQKSRHRISSISSFVVLSR